LGRLMEKGSCTVMAFYPTRAVQFGFQFISATARDSLRRLGPMFYRRPLDWLNFFHADVHVVWVPMSGCSG
jgi:hypothetical protein